MKLLDHVCKDVEQGNISNIKSITNLLYTFAKFKYQPPKNDKGENIFLQKCSALLKSEPALSIAHVCRNLWNFSALDFYDHTLFNKFGAILAKTDHTLAQTDVACALSAFAQFEHL